jgi:UPF0716 protein FxsA
MLPLFFFAYPFLEIYAWYIFIERYSFSDAVMLVFTTGILGMMIVYLQGRIAIMSFQASLAQGKVPTNSVLHKALVMFGGLLIFAPGLFSKLAGAILVLPGLRHLAVIYLKFIFSKKIASGTFKVFSNLGGFGGQFSSQDQSVNQRDVFEVTPKSVEHTDVVSITDDPNRR